MDVLIVLLWWMDDFFERGALQIKKYGIRSEYSQKTRSILLSILYIENGSFTVLRRTCTANVEYSVNISYTLYFTYSVNTLNVFRTYLFDIIGYITHFNTFLLAYMILFLLLIWYIRFITRLKRRDIMVKKLFYWFKILI